MSIRFDLEEIGYELVDTRGGYTYRYTYYTKDGDDYRFYEEYTGHKDSDLEEITDPSEIEELMQCLTT